jgi:hypothetical protein
MSNVKQVEIIGEMPFNVYEHDAALRHLGQFNCPAFGLRIGYGAVPHMVPNERGGQTAFYSFNISGREAVAYDALDGIVMDLRDAGCMIGCARARDVENGGPWVNLLKSRPVYANSR